MLFLKICASLFSCGIVTTLTANVCGVFEALGMGKFGVMLCRVVGTILILMINYKIWLRRWKMEVRQATPVRGSRFQTNTEQLYTTPIDKPSKATLRIIDQIQRGTINTVQLCRNALQAIIDDTLYLVTFTDRFKSVDRQLESFGTKKRKAEDFMKKAIGVTDGSYTYFLDILILVENKIVSTTVGILNQVILFDEQDYVRLQKDIKSNMLKETMIAKSEFFRKYIQSIDKSIDYNEELLLRLDELLMSLGNLKNINRAEIDNLSALQEIKQLINEAAIIGGDV